jgi:hypothetical protein
VQILGSGVKIAVSPSGVPWVVNASGSIYEFKNGSFTEFGNACAKSMEGRGPSLQRGFFWSGRKPQPWRHYGLNLEPHFWCLVR